MEKKKDTAKKEVRCVSCGKKLETEANWVEFSCPQCGKSSIRRCEKCKKMENHYECEKCGFVGP